MDIIEKILIIPMSYYILMKLSPTNKNPYYYG